MKVLLFFLTFFYLCNSKAEYRVFELVIQNQSDKSERTVISNLDPFQYPGYYDLRQGEIVMYRDTWMCWDDSSYFKSYCTNPKLIPTVNPNLGPEQKTNLNQSPADRNLASP